MSEKDIPNLGWETIPHGLIHGFEMRDGEWVRVTYKMQDGKITEIPTTDEEDHTQP